MLDSLKNSLEKMEKSFSLNIKNVKDSSLLVKEELDKIKYQNAIELSKDKKKNETISLIEKLSIQNEFKLNLLKDFSSYNSNQK